MALCKELCLQFGIRVTGLCPVEFFAVLLVEMVVLSVWKLSCQRKWFPVSREAVLLNRRVLLMTKFPNIKSVRQSLGYS
jgi:hypothetical protein